MHGEWRSSKHLKNNLKIVFENIFGHSNEVNPKQGYFCGSFYQSACCKLALAPFFYQNKLLIGF
jgi:hypothetical protein